MAHLDHARGRARAVLIDRNRCGSYSDVDGLQSEAVTPIIKNTDQSHTPTCMNDLLNALQNWFGARPSRYS